VPGVEDGYNADLMKLLGTLPGADAPAPEVSPLTPVAPFIEGPAAAGAGAPAVAEPLIPLSEDGFVDVAALADRTVSTGRVAPLGKRRSNPLKSGSSDPQGRAVRLAQTLASDAVSYRKADYDRARAQGTDAIRTAFQDDIEECRRRYFDQVSEADVPEREAIFTKAINDILGKGAAIL
jgi:hypothetical protein